MNTGSIGPTRGWDSLREELGASADHKLEGSWRKIALQQQDLALGLDEAA